jgi:hypothetical protein
MAQQYIRYEVVPVQEIMDDIFRYWNEADPFRVQRPNGKWVGVSSLRLKTFGRAFKRSVDLKCVGCGCKATHFAVESSLGQERPHLNLYGIKDGKEILFTHDHILARSLGGDNNLHNTQLMCSPCNFNKSKAETKEYQRRQKLAENEKLS